MFHNITTLTQFIIEEEKNNPNAHGDFTLLLINIQEIGKIIASHIKRTGLVDIVGKTGNVNAYDEEVQKLDEYSNKLFVDVLSKTKLVSWVSSEELPDPILINREAKYMVFFDPLDGSSNIDVNINIGSIFSIYKTEENPLQPGKKQIAAGYILYGPSVMFIFTTGNTVDGFTLDPSIGSFILSHKNIQIPQKGEIYSVNESNVSKSSKKIQDYVAKLKSENYKSRYVGSMVADIHRTLIKGGVFMYPADEKNTNGKLRLMFEVNPMSMLIEKAGGLVIDENGNDPMENEVLKVDQKSSVIMGSKLDVEKYL
jgi:fructose-1,6-bisphosphatase I